MRFSECHFLNSRTRLLAVWVWLLLTVPQISWAAGTPAGTAISNTVTLSYSLGAVPQADIPATSIAFLVDEKVNLTVAGGVTTNVAPGSTAQATALTVTNNSNSPLDFNLAVTSAIAVGDNFDPTACSAFVESGATAGYQPLQDTATFIDELSADGTATVYAVCNIPGIAVDTNTGLVGLTATALGNFTGANGTYVATPGAQGAAVIASAGANTQGTVDILFADVAGTEDAARDANHSAHNTYLIAIPALLITKTAVVVDPIGTAVPMPNAVITYQINVKLSGAGTVTNLVITDPMPANTTYDSSGTGSITLTCISGTYTGGGACGIGTITIPQPTVTKTDTNADADFADFTANTVTVSLGNVAAPAEFDITFRATIN